MIECKTCICYSACKKIADMKTAELNINREKLGLCRHLEYPLYVCEKYIGVEEYTKKTKDNNLKLSEKEIRHKSKGKWFTVEYWSGAKKFIDSLKLIHCDDGIVTFCDRNGTMVALTWQIVNSVIPIYDNELIDKLNTTLAKS